MDCRYEEREARVRSLLSRSHQSQMLIWMCCLGRWEHSYYPLYFFPIAEVPEKYLERTSEDTYDVVVDGKRAAGAAIAATSGPFSGLVKLEFGKMDAWFEEDEQIFDHPKDPYKVCTYHTQTGYSIVSVF